MASNKNKQQALSRCYAYIIQLGEPDEMTESIGDERVQETDVASPSQNFHIPTKSTPSVEYDGPEFYPTPSSEKIDDTNNTLNEARKHTEGKVEREKITDNKDSKT